MNSDGVKDMNYTWFETILFLSVASIIGAAAVYTVLLLFLWIGEVIVG